MDIINDILESSSVLIEELSSFEPKSQIDAVRKFIECRIMEKGIVTQHEFKPGLDWINVSKALTFKNDLKGKLVVLDFFTYCCINCMHVLPQLKSLEQEFTVEDGLVVIGVHSPKFSNERSTDNVRAAVERYEINHSVVNDHGEDLWTALGICCWPTIVIVGPNREVLLYLMGESHEKVLHLFVKEALRIFKERGAISSHQITEISVLSHYREPDQLYFPGKICATQTPTGCLLAIADTGHHRLLVVNGRGDVQHVVGGHGSGFEDGSLQEAKFHSPQGLVFTEPSILYVADTENHALRKVDLAAGTVETVAGDGGQGDDMVGGGVGRLQRLSSPWDVVLLSPTVLLVAMAGCHQLWAYFLSDTVLWKKAYAGGVCAAVAGSGREENRNNAYPQRAGFAQPSGLTTTAGSQQVYVADSESSTVRAISGSDGKVTAVVGGMADPQNLFAFGDKDGCGLEVRLQHPLAVAWSEHKQLLYVCDSYNHKLKAVDPGSRHCSTVTLQGDSPTLNEPGGMCAVDNLLYVADTNNHCIKIINVDNYYVKTMPLTFISNTHKEKKELKPVKEVQVTVSSGGGVLELRLTVNVSPDVKPLAESPAVWSLALPEGWKESKSETENTEQRIKRSLTLEVPAGNLQQSCQLRAQCRLFYCHNNLCSARVLPFLVSVNYSDSAPSLTTCDVEYLFNV